MTFSRSLVPALGLLGTLFTLTIGACSSRDGFDDNQTTFSGPDGAASDSPASCGFRCSPDLKKVIKGCVGQAPESEVTCGPDQGCGVDTCVDACQSAVLSKGSVGCSFYALPADDSQYGAGGCFAAMIANTWDRAVTLGAEYAGKPLDVSKSIYTVTQNGNTPVYAPLAGALPPGEVGIVFLAQSDNPTGPDTIACPAGTTPALRADPLTHGTAKTSAFHLTTDAPVAAYSIFPYGGAASQYPTATLLLPVSSWDTSYFAVATAKIGLAMNSNVDRRTLQIVAQEDGTDVSLRPSADLLAGIDVAPALAGDLVTATLAKGQVLQITQRASMTGSPIRATKPIGVFGGSPCAFLPGNDGYCDLTQQQIAPFAQWGTAYALAPFFPRTHGIAGPIPELVPYGIVGAVDGTVLTYDPLVPPGAPTTINAGESAVFMSDTVVTVKSQDSKHPFHAAVYMTAATFGGGAPGGGTVSGDPDFVNVVPADQFLDRYVFFADFTYPDTALTIVRKKAPDGFHPVTLACAGEITGFAPIGTSGAYEYALVQLTSGFVRQKFGTGECGYGRHEATSDGLFSVTVWGTGKDTSYGYAAGAGSRPVNDAPPPIVR